MKFQDKLLSIVKNEQLLKNIRTGIILSLAVILPLGYFAYADSLTIDKIVNFEFGALIVIVWATLQMVTKETKLRARDDKYAIDNDLVDLDKTIEENKKTIISKDKSLKHTTRWVSKYNKEQQDLYNEILTNDKIYELEQKARDYRLDGKDKKAEVLDKEVDKLKMQPLIDKSFEKYDVKLIANYNTSKFKRKKNKGNSEINVDPTKLNKKMGAVSLAVRAFGIGIFGSIPIMFSESIGTILAFYLMYTLTLGFTIIVNYLVTSWIMDKLYKPSLKRIVDIQEILLEYLDQEQEPTEPIEHDPFTQAIEAQKKPVN